MDLSKLTIEREGDVGFWHRLADLLASCRGTASIPAFGSATRNGWDYFLFGILPVLSPSPWSW